MESIATSEIASEITSEITSEIAIESMLFTEYYTKIWTDFVLNPNASNDTDLSNLYIFIKFQLKNYTHMLEIGYDETGEKFLTMCPDGVVKQVNSVSENEYLQLCDTAKLINDFNTTTIPEIIVPKLLDTYSEKKSDLVNLFKIAISKYFTMDTSFNESEKKLGVQFLIGKINEQFHIDIDMDI